MVDKRMKTMNSERNSMKLNAVAILAIGAAWSFSVSAGNVTVVQHFDGSESTMPISSASEESACRGQQPPAVLPYIDVGPFTVTQSGDYRVSDIYLWEPAPVTVRGSANTVLMIYDGGFDPVNPGANRIAGFDFGDWNFVAEDNFVALTGGQNYRLVLQKTCDADPGIGGWVISGPGDISGVGYATSQQFYGDFSEVSNSNAADFPDWGTHLYADPYSYTAPKTGYYRFFDLSQGIGGGATASFVYSAPFDPADPGANLIAAPPGYFIVTPVYLQAGQEVHVIQVDVFDNVSLFQTILHPPGDLAGISSDFVGSYFDMEKKGQGFLVDMDDNYEFLFTALFTYSNASALTLESARNSGKQAVGSSDQRWLTAYGPFSEDSTEVDLVFELTYGGRFNSMTPPATREDAYGSGKLVANDCENIDIQYSLPDGEGVFNLTRILPGFVRDCYATVPVGEPVQ
jgi:hypothetical protein